MIANAAHKIRLYASGFPFTFSSKKKEYTEVIIKIKKAM